MDIPSLFMIPSAVSSGKVHSVFPNSTDADFDFNRDSSATRVNSQGLIEEVGYFGSELVTNGSFDADSNWSKGTGWSIANGKASKVAGSAAELTQASVFPSGFLSKTFRITFTLEVTAGSVRLRAGTNSQSYLNSSGTYSYTLTPAGNDQLKFDANSSFAGSVDNVSVKELTGDRARLNYEIEGGLVNSKPSLLLEPQSTNLIPYSEDFSQWINQNSIDIANQITSPDGNNKGTKVESTSTSSNYIYRQITLATSTAYSISVFVKKGTSNIARLDIFDTVGGTEASIRINLDTEATSFINGTASFEKFPNDWYKLKVSFTSSSSLGTSFFRVFQESGVSGQYIYVFGAQLEQQSYCTSYIPTNGSTQTRAAETCNGAGTSSIFNDSEGILFAELKNIANDGTNKCIAISRGLTVDNRVTIVVGTGDNVIRPHIIKDGVAVFDLTTNSFNTVDNFVKIAVRYKTNDFACWVNGTQALTDTSGDVPTGLNTLKFDVGNNTLPFYGKIRDIRVYNTKEMTDSEVDILLNKITS